MTWARLDDGFYAHPKVRKALSRDPMSIALFSLAISWSAGHEQDGAVPDEALEMLVPSQPKRDRAAAVLEDVGLIHRNGEGIVIHDYLDYNLSRADLTERRRIDRDRKNGSKRRPR